MQAPIQAIVMKMKGSMNIWEVQRHSGTHVVFSLTVDITEAPAVLLLPRFLP